MAYKFINPYNFVPLSKNAASYQNDDVEGETYTGVIEYSLLTKTPLFIPNSSNDHAILPEEYKKSKHKSYEFFAYENLSEVKKVKNTDELAAPVIPGSEMRGMLRSNYEILTNSCLSAVDDDVVMGRRTGEVFAAGLLHKETDGTYTLCEAKDCLLRTMGADSLEIDLEAWGKKGSPETFPNKRERKCYVQKELHEGQKVYVKIMERPNKAKTLITELSDKTFQGAKVGYVLMGEEGPETKTKKHCCHIFVAKNVAAKALDSHSVASLDAVLEAYKNNDSSKKAGYRKYSVEWSNFKKGKGEEYFPVYYSSVDNKYFMFSPAAITREIYNMRISDMIIGHQSCKEKGKLCKACKLFGMLNSKTQMAVASRVRVSDLTVDTNNKYGNLYEKPVTLRELSTPKLQNVEFYLKRPNNAWFWTYDYYVDEKGKAIPYNAEINGRKFYWHNLKMTLDSASSEEKNERNSTVRPVKSGTIFKGRVMFDDITKSELDELIFLLDSGDEDELTAKLHGYKLGGAKPLGLGSVALAVECVKIRTIKKNSESHSIEYSDETYNDYNIPTIDKDIVTMFRKMTDFKAIDKEIREGYEMSYPLNGDEPEIFKWFVGNHKLHRINKTTGFDSIVSMGNSRSMIFIDEYMQAMEPALISTGVTRKLSGGEKRKSEDKPKNNTGLQYKIGDKFKGKVVGHNHSGKFARIVLESKEIVSAFDEDDLAEGTEVVVMYGGIDKKEYPVWKIK